MNVNNVVKSKNICGLLFLVAAFIYGIINIAAGASLGKLVPAESRDSFTVEIVFGILIFLTAGIGLVVTSNSYDPNKVITVFVSLIIMLIVMCFMIQNGILASDLIEKPDGYLWSMILWGITLFILVFTLFGEVSMKHVSLGITAFILQVIVVAINYGLLLDTVYICYLFVLIFGAGTYLTIEAM